MGSSTRTPDVLLHYLPRVLPCFFTTADCFRSPLVCGIAHHLGDFESRRLDCAKVNQLITMLDEQAAGYGKWSLSCRTKHHRKEYSVIKENSGMKGGIHPRSVGSVLRAHHEVSPLSQPNSAVYWM
jgi:hypothetical protein